MAEISGWRFFSVLVSRLPVEWRLNFSMPRASRGLASLLPCDQEDVVDKQRESSGHAPIAGVGRASGGGESQRNDGV